VKLHLGSGDLRFLGWANLDLQHGHDLRRGLPEWEAGSVEAVYSCHLLEHLSHEEGERLLREVHRVLRPGGVVRVGVPDFRLFARAYLDGDEAFSRLYFERYCGPASGLPGDAPIEVNPGHFERYGAIGALLAVVHGWGHRAIYDEEVLRRALVAAGFEPASIQRCAFGQSHYYGRCELDLRYEDHSVFVEAER
jgi:SAM-dependent methyltransferase